MRMIVGFVIVVVSLALASAAFSSGPEHVVARHVNCCFSDGQCLKTRRHHCELKRGRVVENCKDCRSEWNQNEPEK